MIARIPKKSASPIDLLDYLHGRGPHGRSTGRGRLIETNLAGSKGTRRERTLWAKQIEAVAALRPRGQLDYVKHHILSFAHGERPADEDLASIARFYLERMGYAEAPWVVYLHTDRRHWHLHIVTTPTTFQGAAIKEGMDWFRAPRVAREIERRWGLKQVLPPREAALASATGGERAGSERTGTSSARAVFQYEVATAASESRSLVAFLERLEARGFRVRLAIDGHGRVRGISFERDGFAFKGSELGRDFSASKLPAAYELAYDPRRDVSTLATFLARQAARSEETMESLTLPERDLRETIALRLDTVNRRLDEGGGAYLVEERERLIRDLARLEADPATPARELESLPRPFKKEPLPDGTYTVAVADPKALASGRLTDEQVPEIRKGWELATLEKSRGWIEGQNRTHDVLVRPQDQQTTVFGFRGLDEAQLHALRTHGFEPAMAVRAGERYDVLLQAHAVFKTDELEAARNHLAAAYELQPGRGVFRDAIHLPGTDAHLGESRARAELVELRKEPFSHSERLLEEARLRVEERHLHRRAEQIELPKLAENAPEAVAAEALREQARLPYPPGEPLEGLQRAIDEARANLSGERPHAALSDAELSLAIEERNRIAVGHALSAKDPLVVAAEPARELVALEGELAHRRREAELPLLEAEARLEAASRSLDAKLKADAPQPEVLAASREWAELAERHATAERGYLERVLAQTENDRERLWTVLQQKDIPDAGLKAYEQNLERALDLAARTGRDVPSPAFGTATHPAARIEEEIFQRVFAGREAARSLETPLRPHTELKDPNLAYLMASHERDLRIGAAEGMLRKAPDSTARALIDASQRILEGDLSPDTLRRAASAALGVEPGAALSTPRELPRSTEALAERYQTLREGLRKAALEMHVVEPETTRATLTRFFSQATEMVRLHQKIQEHERQHLGLTEPPKPGEKGFREKAVAWLERALEKGLSKEQAASQLSNRVAQPFLAAGKAGPAFALSAASFASRIAMNAALNHMRRVMDA